MWLGPIVANPIPLDDIGPIITISRYVGGATHFRTLFKQTKLIVVTYEFVHRVATQQCLDPRAIIHRVVGTPEVHETTCVLLHNIERFADMC